MKKYIYMAVAAIAALSSCSNEDEIVANENGKGETTFFATMEKDATTRVALNGKTPRWESGDVISIDGHTYTAASDVATTGAFTGTGATEATHHAYYPASMYSKDGEVVTISLPASYVYTADKFDMPMYAESSTTELSFYNLCGVLAITVPSSQMSSVTSIEVSSDQQMNGAISSITDAGVLTFASATLTSAEKKVTLTASSAVTITTSVTFYVPVPAGTHNPLKITVSDGTTTKTMTTKKSGGVTVARNKIYPITFADNAANPHLLSGSFSVSSSEKVKFTKSNLYWSSSDSKFHFEAKPTDYPTTRETTHVGHFFWATTAEKSYASSYDGSGATTSDTFFADGKGGRTLTVDGVGGLYVLSAAEWKYLLEERDNASSLFKYGVTVNGIANCLVIAPDGFTGTIAGTYTLEALETAGLVCLPAAGQYVGSSVVGGGIEGSYWSSSLLADEARNAQYLYFKSGLVSVYDYRRHYLFSLRVVFAEN